MSDEMNRRVFLGRAASLAAGSALLGGLEALGQTSRPASEPALEWRNRQPTMAYAKLGRTNFMVSRCVFGAAGLYGGGKGDLRLLEAAIERGVNYIDTARGYGQSESALAGVLKKCREKVWIVSKATDMGYPRNVLKRGEDARAAKLYTDQLEESLRQLGVDTIDCYMVQGVEHDWVVTMDSLYEAFTKARKAGKVRFFGLATHTNVQDVCELAARTGRYDVVQLAVNPRSLEELGPAVKTMRAAGIGVISMKTGGPIGRNPKIYDPCYDPALLGGKLSPFQRAFAYMLARGRVDAFNSHMPTRQILEENLAVPTLKLAQADLDRIEEQVLAATRDSCRHCGDCDRACPNGLRPSVMLRCYSYEHHYRDPGMARAQYAMLGRDPAASCTGCGRCRSACRASIDLPAVIESLRERMA
ncbi:MAG: aldo/keto reductase [Phycisphaerae bacterium]